MSDPDSLTTEYYRQTVFQIIKNLNTAYNLLIPKGENGVELSPNQENDILAYTLRQQLHPLIKQIELSAESAIISPEERKDIELLLEQVETTLEKHGAHLEVETQRKINDALREIKKVMLKK